MTFEELQKANETLSTMDIKGKDYVLVNERVKAFRMLYPDGTITTEILSNDNGVVVMQAKIIGGGQLLATGLAYEKESSNYINKTSYIENCETSAVGRALGFIGIGIDTAIASYEEVQNAVNNQGEKSGAEVKPKADEKKKRGAATDAKLGEEFGAEIAATFIENGINPKFVCKLYGVNDVADMTEKQMENAVANMNKIKAKQAETEKKA